MALAVLARVAGAQQPPAPVVGGRCQLDFENKPATHTNNIQQPSGAYNSFIGGGVVAHCAAQGMTIVADSAEYFGDVRMLHLVGHVHYAEPRVTLDSKILTYWMGEERLRAEGDVHTALPTGTTLDGPVVEYYRAVAGVRPSARMVAPQRPRIKLVQADSAGKPTEPVGVIANTVVMDGDSLVYASGRVEITRPDLVATADSAFLDSQHERARLMRGPSIVGKGERSFTLTGALIDLYARQRQLERLVSAGSARTVSEDVTLTSDTLDLRFSNRLLQRAFSWGASRAHAVSKTYDIMADSLDVVMPQQRITEVRAVRRAFAQSVPDTVKIHSRERDWLRGDTVVALFDTSRVAPAVRATRADSTRDAPRIRQLVANGRASSFYQMPPQDTSSGLPAANYVRGRTIVVAFAEQLVRNVTITERASGVYLEPSPIDSTPRRSRAGRAGKKP